MPTTTKRSTSPFDEQDAQGLKGFNQILLIECKNWSRAVGSMDVNWFITKIRNRGLDFGIRIAAHGITGDAQENEIIRFAKQA